MLNATPALTGSPVLESLRLCHQPARLNSEQGMFLFGLVAANAASIKALTPEIPPFGPTMATRCALRDGIDALASRIGMTADQLGGVPGYHASPCGWLIDRAALLGPMPSVFGAECSGRLDKSDEAAHLERVKLDAEAIERQAKRLAAHACGAFEVTDVAAMIAALAQQIAWAAAVLAAGQIDAASFGVAFGLTGQAA